MSTRANIILKDGDSKLIFYRHSDGYPEGTLPILNAFLDRVKSGELRDSVSQSAGHLILMGRDEMHECFGKTIPKSYAWKASFIEPSGMLAGDAEYHYTIDLVNKTIKVKSV
jgi:hypothetical protein